MPPSHVDADASNANMMAAIGNVPYAAASERLLAEVSRSTGTMFGTDASLAGDHASVKISITNDASTRPDTLCTNGSDATTAARPRSQTTITFLRSQRSIITPATGARKNPGMMRADMTRPTAAPPDPPPTSAARMVMARKPSQSPTADTTCAIQRRKNACDP